jgi:hypothetical protein
VASDGFIVVTVVTVVSEGDAFVETQGDVLVGTQGDTFVETEVAVELEMADESDDVIELDGIVDIVDVTVDDSDEERGRRKPNTAQNSIARVVSIMKNLLQERLRCSLDVDLFSDTGHAANNVE